MKRLRWKRESKGQYAAFGRPPGFKLHDGEKTYAMVSPLGGDWRRPLIGWYWVAGWDSDVPYKNTCDHPVETPECAKEQAEAYVRQYLHSGKK